MAGAIAFGAALAAVVDWRARTRHRLEARTAARLARGPDGIVLGAEPIALDGEADRAVLLLHGFGDTPQSVAGVARALHAAGWTVRAPLLPGHGRSLADFAASGADAWLRAARAELAALRATHRTVALVGQSMGGALAVALAAESRDVAAVVLLAPYLAMPALPRVVGRAHPVVGLLLPWIDADGAERSIHDPAALAASRGYGATTPRLIGELRRVWARADAALGAVRAPTRVVLSRQDNRVDARAAAAAVARLGCAERDLVWLEECGHVVAVDRERERVFALTGEWLARHAPAVAPASHRSPTPARDGA